jgi:cyclophilin family peptidyl-prolyl cis-trans isomerase
VSDLILYDARRIVNHPSVPWGKLLSLAALALAAGCGRGGDGGQPAATAINGASDASDAPSGDVGGSALRGKPVSAAKCPEVLIETSLGAITVRLESEKSPLTTRNFLSYVAASHYDQTLIHQVYKGKGIVGGGYDASGAEKRARTPIRNEARNNQLKNRRGTIAMARPLGDIDGAACQFFINVSDNPNLDYRGNAPEEYGYCVFGRVVAGMDVVDRIAAVPLHDVAGLSDRTPVQPVLVKSIRQTQ